MNNAINMDIFLQRMLKKSDRECGDQSVNSDGTRLKVEYSPQSNRSANWMKKLGACSPGKSELTSNTRSQSRPITAVTSGEYRNDYRRRNWPPVSTTPKCTTENEEVSNLERIRREFEMGFSSPTKLEPKEPTRSGRFVKKIVAAFEEKYKAFNDVKAETKISSIESDTSDDSSFEDEKTIEDMLEESLAILDNKYVIESLESRLSRYLDSYIATSSSRDEESRTSDDEIDRDLSRCSFAMDEELPLSRSNAPSKNETIGYSRETNSPWRTNDKTLISNAGTRKIERTDSSLRRERRPKIVGAYLKKPIDVEETSIDWIPITGKKLPRKRSFKRLLSMLTGKKLPIKSSKLYSSEMNLREETATEILHDSGYDEKSGSTSSLVSLVSINDLMSQQKHRSLDYHEDDRRSFNMTTFRKKSTIDAIDDETDDCYCRSDDCSSLNDDDNSDTSSLGSRKLMFDEVSREELRLSLGPVFPSINGARVVCSLDRRDGKSAMRKSARSTDTTRGELERLAPPLPKHPFVSLKKKIADQPDDTCFAPIEIANDKSAGSFDFFDNIELRRDHESWTFPTEEYDIPRRNLFSKSELGLVSIGKQRSSDDSTCLNVYDVPKFKIPTRPRSSIYEDALSLKRRNENLSICRSSVTNEFYGFSSDSEPHYATVKPRNTRIQPSREFMRSVDHLNSRDSYRDDYIVTVGSLT